MGKSAGASAEHHLVTEEVCLDLGVKDEDESTTSSSENVGEGTFEEGFGTFLCEDLSSAVNCASVLDITALLT